MRSNKPKIKIVKAIVLVVAAFMLTLLLIFNSGVAFLEKFAGIFIIPLQKAAVTVGRGIGGFFGGLGKIDDYQSQIKEQEQEIAALKIQLQISKEENLRLSEYERFFNIAQNNKNFSVVPAKITGQSPDNWSVIYIIDKGTNDGMAVDMPVIGSNGSLVGRIFEVSSSWSKIITVVDNRSSVPAIVESTRDTGILRGETDIGVGNRYCRLMNMPFEAGIEPGDVVLTSGMGGVFPKGLVIGTVVEVTSGKTSYEQYARVKPSADLAHLEYVLVIKQAGSGAGK